MLWTLAIDHRNSFRTQFLGVRGALSPGQEYRVRAAKALALEALLEASSAGLGGGSPALLIDEEYGADLVGPARQHGITVVMPVEKSGQDELTFEYGDDGYGAAVERLDPDFVKALVRYHPEDDQAVNARQRERLSRLQAWLRANDRDWMLEVLVPPSAAERAGDRFHSHQWDTECRPLLTVDAVEQLVGAGLSPAFWKLEGMPSTAAYEAVAEATRGAGREDAACLVLGRGADTTAVDRWLALAAPLPAYRGFAVGRTLWWEPLRAWWEGAYSGKVVVQQIAANYARTIEVYLAAAG